jgi:hypothetical protein
VVLGLAAGCGNKQAVPPTPTLVPTPRYTPIPADLSGYASAVGPVLDAAIGSTQGLIKAMQSADLRTQGDVCDTYGGDLANDQTAVRSTFTPRIQRNIYYTANSGFKLVLSAIDECGMASDANSKQQMKHAAGDARQGLGDLRQAQSMVKRWVPATPPTAS